MLPNYLKRELMVLFFLLKKKVTSLEEVATECSFSKRAVKESFSAINQHAQEFLSLSEFVKSDHVGNVQIHPDYQKDALEYAFSIKLSLLKENIPFQYGVLLVTNSFLKKEEIMDQLFISLSYLNKLNTQLNLFFAPFDFKIEYTKQGYCLQGNEMNIRIFSHIFLQDAFQDMEWPFSKISLEGIQDNIPEKVLGKRSTRSNTKNRSLAILYTVLQNRIAAGQIIQKPQSAEMQEIFELIRKEAQLSAIFPEEMFGKMQQEDIEVEIQYFSVLSNIFLSDIFSKAQKEALGQFFYHSEHPYCAFAREILSETKTLFPPDLSQETIHLYTYYVTIFHVFYQLVGSAIEDFFNIFSTKTFFSLFLKNNYLTEAKEKIQNIPVDETYQKLLANLIYTLSISNIKSEIKIYVQMTKDITAHHFIENRFRHFYNEEQIHITTDYAQADLVITDTLEREKGNKRIFYLDSIRNEDSWGQLLVVIQEVYLAKQAHFK